MHKIQFFNVAPSLPEELKFLETLSYNMWWSWNPHAIELFRRIDRELWKECCHNPFIFFRRLPQAKLESLLKDKGFMSHYKEVKKLFETEVSTDRTELKTNCTAYFSMEFGIHESIRLYSGGLGILAGDHLKSASDLRVPLAAVGLFYRHGYFQQSLSQDGWQQETALENDIHNLPLKLMMDAEKKPIQISIPMPNTSLKANIWCLDVGNVPLYLLDPTITENKEEYQSMCSQLYDANPVVRLRQEILLGVGGFLALEAMGYKPKAYHMNEGHAAFLSLARIGHLVQKENIPEEEATELVSRTNIFTTHTPVPAGNETFAVDLLKPYLEAIQQEFHVHPQKVIELGQAPDGHADRSKLSMTILALRTSHLANGVSKLHGKVSREMWKELWPNHPIDEIPITSITNGIHVPSWISNDNAALYDRYIGTEWRSACLSSEVAERVMNIPDEELWRARCLGRSRLIRNARDRGERQMCARNATQDEVSDIKSVLHQDALTIGFARRFATYKRATLLLKDRERLKRLLTNEKAPVQIVFAGKAHPADDVGKSFIQEIVQFAREAGVRNRIIFLENYNIEMARDMVQGVDVWLNTPRRPQEASGTSGMKATINGALHLSVLDGWWDEGYCPECGWAIGKGEEHHDTDYQDNVESLALFNVLENEIVPLFYDRPDNDMPRGWIEMMKSSICMSIKSFTSHRMIADYQRLMYSPSIAINDELRKEHNKQASWIVQQRKRLSLLWKDVSIAAPQTDREVANLHAGDKFGVSTSVTLGELTPDEVDVEFYYGPVNASNEITESTSVKMSIAEDHGNGTYLYSQEITCDKTGRYGMTTRVKPSGTEWKSLVPGFITWANGT